MKNATPRVVLIPLLYLLYDRMRPWLRSEMEELLTQVREELSQESLDLTIVKPVASTEELQAAIDREVDSTTDLLVVAHLCYSPSGQMYQPLLKCDAPLLLWPFQPLAEIEPEKFSCKEVTMNHAVHGTMDLANVLKRNGRQCATIHGHWRQAAFIEKLVGWAKAGQALRTFRNARPLVFGEPFPDMLDLRLDDEPFIKAHGPSPCRIPLQKLKEEAEAVGPASIATVYDRYQEVFDFEPGMDEVILKRAAKNQVALTRLLDQHASSAIAVNFIDACNAPGIQDTLHLPGSVLMSHGIGYAAETDWVTSALQAAFAATVGIDMTSFSEVFSVDYTNNCLLLRHFGEGNTAISKGRPRLLTSHLGEDESVSFPICDFEFRPGKASLINLTSTPDSQGQLFHISGEVLDTSLPQVVGVRALFKPNQPSIADLLDNYTNHGGSHHNLLVYGDATDLCKRISTLSGWSFYAE